MGNYVWVVTTCGDFYPTRITTRFYIFISQLNEVIGFTVSVKRSEDKWFVTCVAERQGERIEMATYSRRGQNPM